MTTKKKKMESISLHKELQQQGQYDVLDRLERRGSTSSKEPKSTPEADGEHDFKSIKGRLDDPFLSILTSVSPTIGWEFQLY